METGVIAYNLYQRGRQHRGQQRNFNVQKLLKVINGPATQERVKHRDMAGYWGHFIRLKFGMIPPETVIIDGKPQPLEPALITTYLNCKPDGTVEHNAEFLDTGPGQIVAKLFGNHTGGFSSAIDSEQSPRNFYGFDYVQEPNFSSNRGYPMALDSATAAGVYDSAGVLDSATIAQFVEYSGHIAATLALLDSVNAEYLRALATLAHVQEENEQLLSLLSAKGQAPVFDGASGPVIVSRGDMERDIRAFRETVNLPQFIEPAKQAEDPLIERLLRRVYSRGPR